MRTTPAILAGRCANGYERGHGHVVHAVEVRHDDELRFGLSAVSAICGAKHGPRSAGWSIAAESTISCAKCVKLLTDMHAEGSAVNFGIDP